MAYPIKVLFGTAPAARWPAEVAQEYLTVLQSGGVKDLDTASLYAESEKTLGALGAPKRFTIHTKAPGFYPGTLGKASVLAGAAKSLAELGVDSVETYFLHSPDPTTPVEETLEAIQELYLAGRFKRFGLSNFKAEDVRKIHGLAASRGYVLPSVYQGNYNPVGRHCETALFPLLRELKISFYAYSPLAGGFLVKSAEAVSAADSGRWDAKTQLGGLYQRLYNKPSLLVALAEWDAISRESGVAKAALAYRWVAHHSALEGAFGDGLIVGASRPAQLEETLASLAAGPLEAGVVARIDRVWEGVKDEAPLDNFNG
ncbi:MAG: hypothetical protein M1832_001333 [Thelocarpon impressellum]|nr:MAG: hypothetical protein M1832_001333 [Thelocarpon impressellum]